MANGPLMQLSIQELNSSVLDTTPFGAKAENVSIPTEAGQPDTNLGVKATEWDTKLAAVAGAQPNKIESISVGGTALPIVNKNVEIGNTGHTILDSAGTEATKRGKLQFKTNLLVSDDSTNGATVVDVNEFYGTQAQVAAAISAGTLPEGATVYITDDNEEGSGQNQGHIIEDGAGTSMAPEPALQFDNDFSVTDDSVNGKTIVSIIKTLGLFIDSTTGKIKQTIITT